MSLNIKSCKSDVAPVVLQVPHYSPIHLKREYPDCISSPRCFIAYITTSLNIKSCKSDVAPVVLQVPHYSPIHLKREYPGL
ncbi:hypothetical protein J6590_060449 [Homalodisca vitripennis]|nr:hypothetical protein J6590_060449 [Homalodisca vitripennis]